MAASKKQILKDEPTEFKLLAIASSLSISQMAWNINRACTFSLSHNTELEDILGFPSFTDRQTYAGRVITLIGNKVTGKVLHAKLSNIDFLMEISGNTDEQFIADTLKQLKTINGIQVITQVQPSFLKLKEPYCVE
ncbi:MAG TPA: IPExxxVDY family protein [Bacteroidales bacterium]|nr:IPExxxVDY family protein [Bacteroidales bacterium]